MATRPCPRCRSIDPEPARPGDDGWPFTDQRGPLPHAEDRALVCRLFALGGWLAGLGLVSDGVLYAGGIDDASSYVVPVLITAIGAHMLWLGGRLYRRVRLPTARVLPRKPR